MPGGAGLRFEVRVVDEVLAEDLAHCTPAGRSAIEAVVSALREEGVSREWLRRYEAEGHDGTRLGGCVKLYIPHPAGQWGAVLTADVDAGRPVLILIAVGERHPERPWRPSVYEVAHRRLHR
ncbi:MAG TPA: hypothetical protein VFM51_09220 [Solirubrobacterales bacterium]|nr:hypothetical protein [Solirubrobacterales bacterium]